MSDFNLKCTEFDFRWGFATDSAPQTPSCI